MLSILGQEGDSGLYRIGGRPDMDLAATYGDRSGVEAIRADNASRDLGATRADHAGHADDLAAANLEADVAERALPGQSPDREDRLARRDMRKISEVVETAAYHHSD